jgi:hypothetical protein
MSGREKLGSVYVSDCLEIGAVTHPTVRGLHGSIRPVGPL